MERELKPPGSTTAGPNPNERARAVANPNARFMRDQKGVLPQPGQGPVGNPPGKPKGPVTAADPRLQAGINKRLGNRMTKFSAKHPNASPEKLQRKMEQFRTGITARHNMRFLNNPKRQSALAGNAPKEPPRMSGEPKPPMPLMPRRTSPGKSATGSALDNKRASGRY